jgi:hypothetical protein
MVVRPAPHRLDALGGVAAGVPVGHAAQVGHRPDAVDVVPLLRVADGRHQLGLPGHGAAAGGPARLDVRGEAT